MSQFGTAERVYVENDWYDGPRAGVADVNGVPHRFQSLLDDSDDNYRGTFLVWPVDQEQVALEMEQWQIFAEWNARYEAGEAGVDSHPAHGGRSQRWDELEALLQPGRTVVPLDARRALAQMEFINTPTRYPASGPGYRIRWRVLSDEAV